MLGAGTVINSIVKVVTAVAILAAVGVFIVKPVLKTTENAVDAVGRQIDAQQRAGREASRDAQLGFAKSRAQSFQASVQSTWPAAARAIGACIKAAGDDVSEMDRCDALGTRLVHTVQSDRSFSLSYADSLGAQGNAAAADRVRGCVKRAGFRPAAMQRCRRLSDDLLFG